MRYVIFTAYLFFFLLLMTFTVSAQKQNQKDLRTLIVFFDGLRPDYITEQTMPNLFAFSKAGCYGKRHHSVYPTVTRVNASSYSTGSYPGTHGLMGNEAYFPDVDHVKAINTGDYKDLNRVVEATNGDLLTAITLGEVLQQAGARMMVFSSGSTGQAMMQNHKAANRSIVNPELILPEEFKSKLFSEVGPVPPKTKPNAGQHKWITDALIRYGVTLDGPLVSSIWFSDPDATAHDDGIGALSSMESIKVVDEQFGRILKSIKEKGLSDNFNIIVSADHGFITDTGKQELTEFLLQAGLKKDKASDDIIVADGAIYVKDHNREVIQNVVSKLHKEGWIGGIFTRGNKAGDVQGSIKGTLSFETIHWDHKEHAADILVTVNWNDEKNSSGYAGMSYSTGVAGHGGFSPYEVHIALLAAGPSFKTNFSSELPTSNVDIAPTILSIHRITIPTSMDGRVLNELFLGNKIDQSGKIRTEQLTTSASPGGHSYKLILHRTVVGKFSYADYVEVNRGGDDSVR